MKRRLAVWSHHPIQFTNFLLSAAFERDVYVLDVCLVIGLIHLRRKMLRRCLLVLHFWTSSIAHDFLFQISIPFDSDQDLE